jgi:hypothetical protein
LREKGDGEREQPVSPMLVVRPPLQHHLRPRPHLPRLGRPHTRLRPRAAPHRITAGQPPWRCGRGRTRPCPKAAHRNWRASPTEPVLPQSRFAAAAAS